MTTSKASMNAHVLPVHRVARPENRSNHLISRAILSALLPVLGTKHRTIQAACESCASNSRRAPRTGSLKLRGAWRQRSAWLTTGRSDANVYSERSAAQSWDHAAGTDRESRDGNPRRLSEGDCLHLPSAG